MAHSEPLHPIEALLLLAIATGRALLTLTIHLIALVLLLAGYRPQRPTYAPLPVPARARPALLASLPVPALRTVARRRLGSAARPGGRRIAQATRSALLEVLA